MRLRYVGVDDCGRFFPIEEHPRRELCEQLGRKHCERMFVDGPDGRPKHIGYVIGGWWIRVYRVEDWSRPL